MTGKQIMKRSLAVTGSYRGITGHDHHVRSIVQALHNRGVEIELHDLPGWSAAQLPKPLQNPWFEELCRPIQASNHLYFCMPHQVPTGADQRTINYTMFEADRIPQPWVALSKTHALTIVPVDSCRQAWIASGAPPDKIKVCPLGVDRNCFTPGLKPIRLVTADGRNAAQYKVRFLNVADVSSRKNLIGLLRAWLTTTSTADDAALILKPGFYSPTAQTYLTKQMRELEQAEGKNFPQAASIFWVTGVIPAEMVPSLYACATHYISVSFGEGFDQPMVEAAASGLQLVAPRHSAYLDYLSDDIAHMIPAKEVPAAFPDDPRTNEFFAGTNWWQPDHEELCLTIRNIIDGTAAGKKSAREALSRLTWSNAAELLEPLIFQ